jgi:hypothetical protein
VQKLLHSQIHDMSHASHVLLLLGERDAAFATGIFETSQELAVVGCVVTGHAQKLVKYPESLARTNERLAQIRTRVLAAQRDKVEEERLQGPSIVDGMASDAQERLVVGRGPAVERDGDFAGCVTQHLANTAHLSAVPLDEIALDGIP